MDEDQSCALAIWLELVNQQQIAGEGTSLINYVTPGLIIVNVDTKRILEVIKRELER